MNNYKDNPIIKGLLDRRSIRFYKPDKIEEELLDTVLEVGTFAASARNLQSAIIVVINDEPTKDRIRKMNAQVMGTPKRDRFFEAPTLIVVFADSNVPTFVEDGSLVLGNMMNAAHALGLGSCWVHHAREEFETEEGVALRREWGIPDNYSGIAHLTLGYPDCEHPEPKPRKEKYVYKV